MKKLFNNSTKGNETQNQSSKSKRKFLKTFSFTSLALLMGAAGVFAFAPLGASPSVASASEMVETTTEQGLITPKADDPVIYTTESGLEIKWGNGSKTALGGGNETITSGYNKLTSGNLSGFPYFTTTSGSTTYTWVVIGRSSTLVDSLVYDKLSTWQTKTSDTPTYKNFFDNTYEATTPAGLAIKNNNILNDYAARKQIVTGLDNVKSNPEIPTDCVLAIANANIEVAQWGGGWTNSNAMYFSGSNNTYRLKLVSYYTNDTFGFGTLKSSLQSISVTQRNAHKYSESSTTSVYSTNSVSLYFFPLGTGGTTQAGVDLSTIENFRWQTYLSDTQVKLTASFWGRSHYNYDLLYTTDPSANIVKYGCHNDTYKCGYRPAFVLKIV